MRVLRHRCKAKATTRKPKITRINYRYMVLEMKKNGDPVDLHRFINKKAATKAASTIQLKYHNQAVIRPYDHAGYTVIKELGKNKGG